MSWKKRLLLKMLLLTLCLVPLTGCLSQLMPNSHSSLTYEEAKAALVAGKTTKEEVRAKFGKPDTISTLNGVETWTYKWSPTQMPEALTNAGRSMGNILTSQAMVGVSQPIAAKGGVAAGVGSAVLVQDGSSALTNAVLPQENGETNKTLIVSFDRKGLVRSFNLHSQSANK